MKIRLLIPFFLLVLLGILLGFHLGQNNRVKETDGCTPSGLHYSYFSDKKFYDTAYKNAKTTPSVEGEIKGVIVNHHLLAPNLIAETINTIATKRALSVILISPNHFSAGQGQIISSAYNWDTPYGPLLADCEKIFQLEKLGVIKIDESPFKDEHGISGIVPFIKRSLPNAKIVPIIIKDTLSANDLNKFVDTLYQTFGDQVLIVGSFDFSHYLPDAVAQFHDKKSLSVLKNFDYTGLKTTELDSIPGLEIVMRYMEKIGALGFNLIANTNSAEILKDPRIEESTSYVDGAFTIGPKIIDHTATILTFGDLMLDRNVRKKINENGQTYPFRPIERFLTGSDIVVANAEGPFTSNTSQTMDVLDGPLTFTFDIDMLGVLKKLGFTLFSQANNHALNFGPEGFRESTQAIEKSGLNWFGDPLNINLHSFSTDIRGQKIAFIGYHQFAPQGFETVINEIKLAKVYGDFVIVYPHWGMEYNLDTTQTQIDQAHAFIDAGADVIIGSHPHVIEPIEIYKNRAIFYSLGNFIFDQASVGPTSEGLSVGIEINSRQVSYYLFPLDIRSAQASLMPYDKRVTVLANIAEHSYVSDQDKSEIKSGKLTLDLINNI